MAATIEELRTALQRLLDDLADADEHRHPETGKLYESVRQAGRALRDAGGTPPFDPGETQPAAAEEPEEELGEEEDYEVGVTRVAYGHTSILVRARSAREAEAKALDEAGNHDFSESSSEYESEGAWLV